MTTSEKKYTVAIRNDHVESGMHTFALTAHRIELSTFGMLFYNDQDQLVAQVPNFLFVREDVADE